MGQYFMKNHSGPTQWGRPDFLRFFEDLDVPKLSPNLDKTHIMELSEWLAHCGVGQLGEDSLCFGSSSYLFSMLYQASKVHLGVCREVVERAYILIRDGVLLSKRPLERGVSCGVLGRVERADCQLKRDPWILIPTLEVYGSGCVLHILYCSLGCAMRPWFLVSTHAGEDVQ